MTRFVYRRSYRGPLQAAILDWAGTAVDFGSFAPAAAFVKLFESRGVTITSAHARSGMGLMKKDHLRVIFSQPEVRDRWCSLYGRMPTEEDVDSLYSEFEPMQLASVAEYATPIPGLLDAVSTFRKRGLKIGTTTGYTRPMMDVLLPAAERYGYRPDAAVSATDVPAGRPYPWMAFANAMQLNIFPMEAMVKVGDTIPDIDEGLNAGMWTVGIVLSGNLMALTERELAALPEDEVDRRRSAIQSQFYKAGAHYVVDTIADVPELIDEIDERLGFGERPS
jgi:phosphonoacetaldehyde hydrolase